MTARAILTYEKYLHSHSIKEHTLEKKTLEKIAIFF